jgi:hypothetical protein
MSKYRFKTEEEFKRDGLWNKNSPKKWVSVMNKYLGQDIPDSLNKYCDRQEKFRYDKRHIEPHDYVLKEIQSEYTVGKWYGCKNWNSPVDFIKLESVYDSQAYFTECLNSGNYKKEGKNWWSFTTADPLFEADMSIVSHLLPDGHPDKIVAEESSFVLPSKWCIKLTEENVVTLGNWRSSGPLKYKRYVEEGWYLHTPKHGAKGYNEYMRDPDYTEITFEQFKQHVLKESPVVETIVETLNQEEDYTGRTIKALVKNPQNTGVQLGEEIKILIKENKDTYILDITARGASNMRINRPLDLSDWELLPESSKEIDMKDIQEEVKKRFPIGCKFIPVYGDNTYTLIEDDCTYKIHGEYIWAHDSHGHLYGDGKWATLVSLPESKEESIPEYVECIKSTTNCFTVGKIYNWPYPINDQGDRRAIPIQGTLFSFKPSTKEAYDAQKTSKQLAKKDLVKGEIYIYDGTQISTYPEGPSISINEQHYIPNPKWMWSLSITHATEEQKALLRREIERNSKPDVMWSSDPIVEQRISTLNMKKQKFKIGDKVKIIQRKTSNRTGNCPGWDIANGNVGEIGVITYYSEPVRPYYVSQIGSDGYIGSFDEEDLELYQKEETTFYSNTELDFGRLDLEDWLRETKKLNLSLKKLTLHIECGNTCNYSKVYNKLECEEDSPHSRAKYLYELWNSKLKKDFIEKEVIKETFIDNVQSVDVILRTKRKSIKF